MKGVLNSRCFRGVGNRMGRGRDWGTTMLPNGGF